MNDQLEYNERNKDKSNEINYEFELSWKNIKCSKIIVRKYWV